MNTDLTFSGVVPDIDRRFGALTRLYGSIGAARIRSAHVVVVGLGGVGSWAAEAAARSGVAQLTLIDMDHLAESNVNRQVHALTPTIGQAKVLAMRDRIALIHPECVVNCIEEFVDVGNWNNLSARFSEKCLASQPLAVLDACDNVSAKTAMAAWSFNHSSIEFIGVGAAGGKRLAHLVDIVDLADVSHDPLLTRLRSNLRKFHKAPSAGKKMGIPYVFSKEAVRNPDLLLGTEMTSSSSLHSLSCHGYGSTVSVTATFGFSAMGWLLDKVASSSD